MILISISPIKPNVIPIGNAFIKTPIMPNLTELKIIGIRITKTSVIMYIEYI